MNQVGYIIGIIMWCLIGYYTERPWLKAVCLIACIVLAVWAVIRFRKAGNDVDWD